MKTQDYWFCYFFRSHQFDEWESNFGKYFLINGIFSRLSLFRHFSYCVCAKMHYYWHSLSIPQNGWLPPVFRSISLYWSITLSQKLRGAIIFRLFDLTLTSLDTSRFACYISSLSTVLEKRFRHFLLRNNHILRPIFGSKNFNG